MNRSKIRTAALASLLLAPFGCGKGRAGDPPLPEAARVEAAKPADRGTATDPTTDPIVVAYHRGVIAARLRFQEIEVDYRRRLRDRLEDNEAEIFPEPRPGPCCSRGGGLDRRVLPAGASPGSQTARGGRGRIVPASW